MIIDRLGGLEPLKNVQKPQKPVQQAPKQVGDTVSVSQEAKAMADAYYLNEIAKATPDIRADLVAEVKEKIKDSSYINEMLIDSTANKIMESFGF